MTRLHFARCEHSSVCGSELLQARWGREDEEEGRHWRAENQLAVRQWKRRDVPCVNKRRSVADIRVRWWSLHNRVRIKADLITGQIADQAESSVCACIRACIHVVSMLLSGPPSGSKPWGLHSYWEPIMCFRSHSASCFSWLFLEHKARDALYLILTGVKTWQVTDWSIVLSSACLM